MFPSGTALISDNGGTAAVFGIDTALYPDDVVLSAAYWLTDRCNVHVAHVIDGRLTAEVRLKDGAGGQPLADACWEFSNALIDAALRKRVSAQTADIQEALLRRAFSESLPRTP